MPVFIANKKNIVSGKTKRKSFIAQFILILLGVELLFLSGFTAFNLPTATKNNLQYFVVGKAGQFYNMFSRKFKKTCEAMVPNMIPPDPKSLPAIRYSLYVPQAPAAIFLGYVLGWPLALISLLGYMAMGIIGPFFNLYVFGAGSGLTYYLQPSFGYLIGMIVAASIVGWFGRGERKSVNQLLSLCLGLLCIHGIGLAYLLGICIFGAVHEITGQQLIWSGWLFEEARNLSWYALPYDIIFSLGLIGIAFPFRWLVYVLTSPDLANVEGPDGEKLLDFKLAR